MKEAEEKNDEKMLGERSILFYTDINNTTTIS